jgi:acyl carrier protein
MNNIKIYEKIRTIVNSINSGKEINENTALIADSILDSLEFMNYITKVEEEFNISISDQEIVGKSLGIVSNMVEFIRVKTK